MTTEKKKSEATWAPPKIVEATEEQAAEPAPESQPAAGAAATAHVVSSIFKGRAGKQAATFVATLTLRHNGQGEAPAAVELFPAGVAVLGFKGPDSVYLSSDYGPTSAVLTGPGSVTIQIKIVVGYQTDTTGHRLTLPLPPAPGHQLIFSVPEKQRSIRVTPAVEVKQSPAKAKAESSSTQVSAAIGPVEQVCIEWTGENQARPRVRAEVGSVAAVTDRRLSMSTRIAYEIHGAGVSNLVLQLPEGAELLGAEAEGLREWQIDRQQIELTFNRSMLGHLTVMLYWEVEIDLEGPFEVPRLTLRDAEREQGYLALESRTNIEISEQQASGIDSIDVRDLPRTVWALCQGPPLMAYKYLEPSYGLTVSVTRHREVEVLVATVDRAFCQSVLVEEGQMETQLRLEVRNNQKQFLRLALPHNAVLWGAFVAGRPVKPAMDHEQHRTLIALEKSSSSDGTDRAFLVEVVYISKLERMGKKGELQLFLPAIDMPINHLFFRIFLPDSHKYSHFESSLNPLESFTQPWPDGSAAQGDGAAPRLVHQQKSEQNDPIQAVRVEPPGIGVERRFERLLLIEGSTELRFRYKRRWGR